MACPHHELVVPVRSSLLAFVTPLTAHLPTGERVGVAFTTPDAMDAVLPDHAHVVLGECGLRELLLAIGVHRIQFDPQLVLARGAAAHAVSA